MKKLLLTAFSLVLCAVMVFALSACNETIYYDDEDTSSYNIEVDTSGNTSSDTSSDTSSTSSDSSNTESKQTPPSGNTLSSGSFASNTGSKINIVVKWAKTKSNSGETMLKMDVTANISALDVSAHKNAFKINVGGKTYYKNIKKIKFSSKKPKEIILTSITVPLEDGEQAVKVSWKFNGTYSGKKLGTITAAGTVK